jgi:hypothetical protein
MTDRFAQFADHGVTKTAVRIAGLLTIPLFLWLIAEFRVHERLLEERLDDILISNGALSERLVSLETAYTGLILPTLERHQEGLDRLQADKSGIRPRFDATQARDMEKRLMERIAEHIRSHREDR